MLGLGQLLWARMSYPCLLMIWGVVTRGSRAPVTADKGNDPPRVRSFVGVGAGPARPPAGPASVEREATERRVSGTSRSSSVPDIGKSRALGHGPESGRVEGL